MRKQLLKSFDKIYIIDLHGSAKKNETTIDGSKDENVFDIQQGVSINLFVKTTQTKNESLGRIYHSEFYGSRSEKYSFLHTNRINDLGWNNLEYIPPYYFMCQEILMHTSIII